MSYHIDTLCVQAGYQPKSGKSRTVPIIQSTTFKYDTSEQMGRLFDLEEAGYFYTRLQNPTNDLVAAKLCALEGGAAAMLTSSGQAATFYSLFNICGTGDHIISSSAIYGGTYNLLSITMKRMGIECSFIHPDAPIEEFEAAFTPRTKAIFAESLANPAMVVLDFEKFASLAQRHGVPFIVDNTFPTPVNCRPFEFGADIIVHSTTKYLDGHGTTVGGAIVDSGSFDWNAHAEAYPGLTEPDESYHGVIYTERFGKAAFITKATVQLMRDLGSIPSPANSFYLNMHMESLALRMERHCSNALTVAEYLLEHPKVSWVKYPGLPSDEHYKLAQRYMPKGTCGVVSFGVSGGRDKVGAFTDSLRLISIATHVADTRTCVLYPAGTTHRQMSDIELEAAGVKPDLIRLSCGIEDPSDIIADLEQALAGI